MPSLVLRTALYSTAIAFAACGVLPTQAMAADGKALYEKHCQSCHGADGKGETKAGKMMESPDLTTAEWKQGKTVADLDKTLRAKIGKMPAFNEKLSDEEIKAVSEYTVGLIP
jgi:cbb3-type cytochrome c oxidase subunit III